MQLKAPKSPDILNENQNTQLGFKRMKTMMPSNSKQQLGNGKTSKVSNYEKQMDDMRSQASRKSVNTYQRSNFKLAEGSDAGELKIENDRLQTTIMILNQKLKTQNDSDGQINGLRKKLKDNEEQQQKAAKDNMTLRSEISQMKSENSFLQSQIETMESTIESLNMSMREKDDEMDKTEEVRADLKQDIEELNGNLQNQEEELYNVKKELHETIQELEETQDELQRTNQELQETKIAHTQELQEAHSQFDVKYQ